MIEPFSQAVSQPSWLADAAAWTAAQLARAGRTGVGPIEQVRVRPWSAQWSVKTDQGAVWLKANCGALVFEGALQVALAQLLPGAVDAPIAIEPGRGWMLTTDRGVTLADAQAVTSADWQRVLVRAAQLQRATASHRAVLAAAGLPQCPPSTVLGRFERLIELFSGLPPEHPSHVPPHLRSLLLARRGEVERAADLLAHCALPVTWQHGDLHPDNVFASDGRMFDFADGQWAAAVEILAVPMGWIASQTDLDWPTIVGAYCDEWGVTMAELDQMMEAASLTQPINRTVLWWSCLQEATAKEWAQWGAAPLHHLTRVLD
jgi:hypothetical protein